MKIDTLRFRRALQTGCEGNGETLVTASLSELAVSSGEIVYSQITTDHILSQSTNMKAHNSMAHQEQPIHKYHD